MFGLLEHLLNAFTSEDSCKVIFYNHLSNKILIEKNMFLKRCDSGTHQARYKLWLAVDASVLKI